MENREHDEAAVLVVAAEIAQAMSHPTRLRIVELLQGDGAYVMDLVEQTGRPQANISQHLAMLREAGLVTAEREGMAVRYRLRDKRLLEIVVGLRELAAAQIANGAADLMLQTPRSRRMMQRCRGGKRMRGRRPWKKW